MSMKKTGATTEPDVTEWDGGFSWIAHPEEGMQRASHALRDGDAVWVVDPVDFDGLDDRLGEAEEVAGVVVLLDRHERAAAAVARRHDAAVHVPAWMDGVAGELDAPVERFEGTLGDTAYRARRVLDNRIWQECALFDGETLVVPEAVGTAEYFRSGSERLGVHPMLRLLPPRRQLGDLDPDRVLTGHGVGVLEAGGTALEDALAGSRRRAPAAYLRSLGMALPG
jgi:hypothetical protein